MSCDRLRSGQPPKSPILGDFELRNGLKFPSMGDLGGDRKVLQYFSEIRLGKFV
jgi:hypothetical protein